MTSPAVQPTPEGESTKDYVDRLIRDHGPPPKRITDLVRTLRAQSLRKQQRSA